MLSLELEKHFRGNLVINTHKLNDQWLSVFYWLKNKLSDEYYNYCTNKLLEGCVVI